jgi:regulatory Fis family protein
MKSSLNVQLHPVAFLYDHLSEFPIWMRKLTPGQLENIASVMIAWHATIGESVEIVPLEEVEKRQMTRAITVCRGDVVEAAEALKVSKTTLYRKLRQWGYSIQNRLLVHQASVLAETPHRSGQSSAHRQ